MKTIIEYQKEAAWMLSQSRVDKKYTQQKMADVMTRSKRTIQNWEDGTSMPTYAQALKWFDVLHVSMMPYYLRNTTSALDPSVEVSEKIKQCAAKYPIEQQELLLHLMIDYDFIAILRSIYKGIEVFKNET